jgi:hypothetical protein
MGIVGGNLGFGFGGAGQGTGLGNLRMGWLTGLEDTFSRGIGKIPENIPQWQQQIALTNTYTVDVESSFLRSSSFFSPVRLTKMGNHLQDITKPAGFTGLTEQIIAPKLYNAGTDNALDYLGRSATLFNEVLSPDFGKNLTIPVDLVNTIQGGTVIPTFSNFPPEALNFFGLQSVLPFYTAADNANNAGLQQFPVGSPLNTNMPFQTGQIQVQPLNFPQQQRGVTAEDVLKAQALGLGGGLANNYNVSFNASASLPDLFKFIQQGNPYS